jgi:L-cysteine:1D-myo-inositol 2-amino-2-deoxy-alpha-D-glucopyranoside ligase
VSRPTGPAADGVLADVRRHLADDLAAPAALAAIDRWAAEAVTRGGPDAAAPGLVRRTADALLGVRL